MSEWHPTGQSNLDTITFTIMYYVHMWCAVFQFQVMFVYLFIMYLINLISVHTEIFFDLSIRCEEGSESLFFFNWSNWSSVFVCLPLSELFSLICTAWAMSWNSGNQSQKGNPPDGGFPCHLVEEELLLWIQHWQIMQIFLNWVETTTEKMTLSI